MKARSHLLAIILLVLASCTSQPLQVDVDAADIMPKELAWQWFANTYKDGYGICTINAGKQIVEFRYTKNTELNRDFLPDEVMVKFAKLPGADRVGVSLFKKDQAMGSGGLYRCYMVVTKASQNQKLFNQIATALQSIGIAYE